MNKLLKQGSSLAAQIEMFYNKLDNECEYFFDAHHDDLRIQMDCAWQEVGELEVYSSNPKNKYGKLTGKECALSCIDVLLDTLTYCEAVINLQEQSKCLPKSIFG